MNQKSQQKKHASHKKENNDAETNAEEDDPFATFEESLTKKEKAKTEKHHEKKHKEKQHHERQVHQKHHEKQHHEKPIKKSKVTHSHAQKKATHKSHAHTDSVPACTSLGCKTASAGAPPPDPWPKDYPVANWGKDHDVETTEKNTAAAEAKLGAWNPPVDENGNFVVPHADAEFKLAATKSDIRNDETESPE